MAPAIGIAGWLGRLVAFLGVVWVAAVAGAGVATAQEGTMSMSDDLGTRLGTVASRSTLRITTIGRRSGKPHTVPIWFVVEGTTLYLGTLNVKRDWVRNTTKHPDVTLDLGGLVLRGRLTAVTDPALERHVHDLLARKYWMAWIGSWLGKGPERVFRVDALAPATS